uniref:Putative uncharacterized protein YMR052C-A n=1 Tax=Saccharomyces cerevisiae (strain ATCC 204508 / S288c) TaxID=559292 RepID=YM052_YEAST|nr:RecName: Full=Putative uncharacterized protein YMR052C-A [Saccharomyces cerevisiae S288C]pir/S69865/ hypothetical protein YMR052c-a - yeast (Saccharomyces cerevisiae) [Saccharomyces cerevisiae]AAT93313.1 YMR052C-A [Saccharomyces cerevisiae]
MILWGGSGGYLVIILYTIMPVKTIEEYEYDFFRFILIFFFFQKGSKHLSVVISILKYINAFKGLLFHVCLHFCSIHRRLFQYLVRVLQVFQLFFKAAVISGIFRYTIPIHFLQKFFKLFDN